jgi:uncharacterized protein YndB with AHSA1/START domain
MKILVIVLALLAAVLIYAATKPDSFRLQRTISINATPEKIFTHLNDFKLWSAWAPWEHLDPGMRKTYSGPPSGAGAVYAWQGNNQVGDGRMEILESSPAAHLKIKLDFLKPMEAHNFAEFMLEPKGGQTDVTWVMYGQSNYLSKLMTTFVSMDALVGKDFERGLSSLAASGKVATRVTTVAPS